MAAIDIGSSKVSCFIGRVADDAGHIEILGAQHHAAQGIQAGVITDTVLAEKAIRRAVHDAEKMAARETRGYPLREVTVNLPDSHCVSHREKVSVQISGHEVTPKDIQSALFQAQNEILSDAHEIVHTIPAGYVLDGAKDIREPVGMHGQKLDINVHMVTGQIGVLQNIAQVMNRSHLEIDSFCVSSYASGLACLVQDEMDLGCTVIDMGGATTSFSVFHDGALLYSDSIPLGGKNVTADLAQGLTTSMANAERLKVLYGSAIASINDDQELIDVPPLGEEEHAEANHVPRALMVGIIQPRVEEIFEIIRARLHDSGLGHAVGRRVVLTGGASQLSGLKEYAQHVLDKQVRLGKPLRFAGLPDSCSGPAFTSTAGMLLYACAHEDERPSVIQNNSEYVGVLKRAVGWLKENW